MLPDLEDDPRLSEGVLAFNSGDYETASDRFEELFFEAVRDEVEVARALLQMAVGALHAERGQQAAAIQRLHEGREAIRRSQAPHGIDLARLDEEIARMIAALRAGAAKERPRIIRLVG